MPNIPLVMDAEQAAALIKTSIKCSRTWSGYTDWKDVLFRNGSHQNYEVNAQGGNEKRGFILLLLIQSKKVLQMYQAMSVSPVAPMLHTKPTKCYGSQRHVY